MRPLLPLLLLLAVAPAACSHAQRAQSEGSAAPSGSATAQPSPSPTPAFSDLQGVDAAAYIDQLTALRVFWPAGGPFEPNKPVQRREFVRWLMNADAAIWAQNPSAQIHASATDARQYFTDVPTDDPDFTAIEGMHDAGIVLSQDRRFHPNDFITRQDALAIKAYVDCGVPDPLLAGDLGQAYFELSWRDKSQISHADVAPIAGCLLQDRGATPNDQLDTVGRTFGTTAMLDPNQSLDRAEAAAMIWKIGQQKPDLNNFPPRTAEEALHTP